MTDIPKGHKQSEVGVIPEDWEVKTLGELGTWKGGMTPSMKNPAYWQNGTVPWISSGDVKSVQLKKTGYCITKEAVKQGTTMMLPAESIVMVTRSGILRKYLPVATNVIPMAINQDIKALIPEKNINASFILHALTECGPRILSRCLKSGTTVESVEFTWLKAFAVPLPPLSEQRAIAAALSDVDELLAGLDRLIAKKRDLKQAAMQQLLTGQIRLPGFHGEWEVKRLEQIVDIRNGGTPSTTQSDFWDGGIPWCTPTDITALRGQKYLTETARTISLTGLRASSAEIIAPNSIIMTSRATIGECAINTIPMTTNQGFKNLISLAGDAEFLYYLMTTQKQRLIQLCGGSTFLEIGKKQLQQFELHIPVLISEQTAIAAVLSDMDAEIDSLERRRAKTADIKQAMMQELLTGRIRLV